KMPAFEWVHVQLHQQKGMISLSPPTICNSAGSPPGYVGSKENTTLLDSVKIEGTFSKPGIVLFDEIEKADDSVILSLLNILDYGELVLSTGNKRINFKNCIIFMTSNLGFQKNIANLSLIKRIISVAFNNKKHLNSRANKVPDVVKVFFPPEFINRIDRVLSFQKISRLQIEAIADLEINKLIGRVSKYNINISLQQSVKKLLIKNYDPSYGAREVNRYVRTMLEPVISESILKNPTSKYFEIKVYNDSFISIPVEL
ncbi:AAA family ATPase, partial [Klebsiella pneumoniae]